MRPLWFVAGAGAGLYVALKARRAAEALTPEGLHDRLAGLQVGWQLFSDEVRAGMTEKETELRAQVARLEAHERRRLGPAAAPDEARQSHHSHQAPARGGADVPQDGPEEGPHDGQQ